MQWDPYTIFSVASGVALLLTTVLPGLYTSDRLWALLGGAACVGYGIYVANQVTGTFVFPVWIFAIPFVFVGYFGLQTWNALSSRQYPDTLTSRPARGTGAPTGRSGRNTSTAGDVQSSELVCPNGHETNDLGALRCPVCTEFLSPTQERLARMTGSKRHQSAQTEPGPAVRTVACPNGHTSRDLTLLRCPECNEYLSLRSRE